MNKIYTILIASAVAASAMAHESEATLMKTAQPVRTKAVKEMPSWPGTAQLTPTNKSLMTLRKADGDNSIEGIWTIYLGDFYDDAAAVGDYIPARYVARLSGTTLTFSPYTNQPTEREVLDFVATYDEAASTLTITKRFYGIEEGYYIYQVPFQYNEKTGETTQLESLSGTYSPEERMIQFPEDYGIEWAGYKDAAGTQYAGYLALFDILSGYEFDPAANIEGEWTKVCEVDFVDPWLVPALGSFGSTKPYKLDCEQKNDDPCIYRLVDPYWSGPVADYNWSETGGYIVFDITNPDLVKLLPADAGFASPDIPVPNNTGISVFYCYNALGFEAVNNPALTVGEIISQFNGIPHTVLADNKITFGSVSQQGQTLYDANFGYQVSPFGGNTWGGTRMTGSITFPESFSAQVGAVAVDENANAEYFDLNGLRVANPQPGQLLVKRAGGKATKVIIR